MAALGINVNLGIVNVVVSNAQLSYATVDISDELRAGFRVKGLFELFGLTGDVDFSLSTDGLKLYASLNFAKARGLSV